MFLEITSVEVNIIFQVSKAKQDFIICSCVIIVIYFKIVYNTFLQNYFFLFYLIYGKVLSYYICQISNYILLWCHFCQVKPLSLAQAMCWHVISSWLFHVFIFLSNLHFLLLIVGYLSFTFYYLNQCSAECPLSS